MKLATLLLAALPVALLAACETPPVDSGSRFITNESFEDIPAPKDARYQTANDESYAYRGKGFRYGEFVYEYDAPLEDAVRFYKEVPTRPPYSWNLGGVSYRDSLTEATIEMTKNEDRCSVLIRRISPERAETTRLRILVRLNDPKR